MQHQTIGFIGGGHMASSLVGGLIEAQFPAEQIWVVERHHGKRTHLQTCYGVQTEDSVLKMLPQVDVVVLAVKPHDIAEILQSVQDCFKQYTPLLISVAAGVTTALLRQWTWPEQAIIRSMPNTPSLVHVGATGLYANDKATSAHKTLANTLFSTVGLAVWVEQEAQLDAVTALSGSGPAYFLLMIEAMQAAGQQLGLSQETASQLALQTALGAATLAKASEQTVRQLREQITSKGGTTACALAILQEGQFEQLMLDAMTGAYQRAQELGGLTVSRDG